LYGVSRFFSLALLYYNEQCRGHSGSRNIYIVTAGYFMNSPTLYESLFNFQNYWRNKKGRFLVISEKTFRTALRKVTKKRGRQLIRLDKMTDATTLDKVKVAWLKKLNYKYILLDSDFNVAKLLLRKNYEDVLSSISGGGKNTKSRVLFIIDAPVRNLVGDAIEGDGDYSSAQKSRLGRYGFLDPHTTNISILQNAGLLPDKQEKVYPIAGIKLRNKINFDKKYRLEFLCAEPLQKLVSPLLGNKPLHCYTIWNPDTDKFKIVAHHSKYEVEVFPPGTSIVAPVVICHIGPNGSTRFQYPDNVNWKAGIGEAFDIFWKSGGQKQLEDALKQKCPEYMDPVHLEQHVIAAIPEAPETYSLTIYHNRIKFEGVEIQKFSPRKNQKTESPLNKNHINLLSFLYQHQNTYHPATELAKRIGLPPQKPGKNIYQHNVYEIVYALQRAISKCLALKYKKEDLRLTPNQKLSDDLIEIRSLEEAKRILALTRRYGCKLSLKK